LLGALTAELAGAGAAVHVLVPATDRALLDGLLAHGYRVFRACQYLVRGGGTATAELRAHERGHDVRTRRQCVSHVTLRSPRASARSASSGARFTRQKYSGIVTPRRRMRRRSSA